MTKETKTTSESIDIIFIEIRRVVSEISTFKHTTLQLYNIKKYSVDRRLRSRLSDLMTPNERMKFWRREKKKTVTDDGTPRLLRLYNTPTLTSRPRVMGF